MFCHGRWLESIFIGLAAYSERCGNQKGNSLQEEKCLLRQNKVGSNWQWTWWKHFKLICPTRYGPILACTVALILPPTMSWFRNHFRGAKVVPTYSTRCKYMQYVHLHLMNIQLLMNCINLILILIYFYFLQTVLMLLVVRRKSESCWWGIKTFTYFLYL